MQSDVQKLQSRFGSGLGPGLPSFVEDSWVRCLDSFQIQPDRARRPAILTRSELVDATARNEDLIRSATPEVERLFRRLAHGDYLVSLASALGEKLLFRCDPNLLGDLGAAGVTLGSIWTEETEGTNGIGTSLKTGRALSIIGDQHFHVTLKSLTCTVAPVLGQNGQILGALNVTSLQPEPQRAVRMLRDIVERSAARIESQLFRKRHQAHRLVALGHGDDYSDGAALALLALDDVGRIVDFSHEAALMLGPQRERMLRSAALSDLSLPEGIFARWENLPAVHAARVQPQTIFGPPIPPIDPRQHELLRQAERLAAGHQPILISGATGVGKSAFAQLLAKSRQSGQQPVVLIDGAADPDQTLQRLRSVSRTEEYTLILDNLPDLTPAAQLTLLGILDAAPVLTLAVTHTPLADLMARGTLRADLAHRLSGSQLTLPALRDAPALRQIITAMFDQLAMAAGRPALRLAESALAALTAHHWPGNLHELKSTLRHAILMATDQVALSDLPATLTAQTAGHDLAARSQHEAARITAALQHNRGNVAATARYLGLSRATLYRKIQIAKLRQN